MGIGFYFMTASGMGNSSSNGLMNVFQKLTGKSVGLIRTTEDVSFMALGFLLGGTVNIGTLILTFGFGYLLNFIYRLFKFDPTKVQHQYLGGEKMKLPQMDVMNFLKHKTKVYELTIEQLKTNIKSLKDEEKTYSKQ